MLRHSGGRMTGLFGGCYSSRWRVGAGMVITRYSSQREVLTSFIETNFSIVFCALVMRIDEVVA